MNILNFPMASQSIPAQLPAAPKRVRGKLTRRKDGYYQSEVRIPIGGDRVKRKVVYAKTQSELKQKADALRKLVYSGADMRLRMLSVREWMLRYLEIYKSSVEPKTLAQYRARLIAAAQAIGEAKPINSIKASDAQRAMNACANASASTIHKTRFLLNDAFKKAMAERALDYNPMDAINAPRGVKGSHRILFEDEIAAISSHWREHRFGKLAMLMLYSGMRRGEALAFHSTRDTDWKSLVLTVREAVHFTSNKPILGRLKGAKLNPANASAYYRAIPLLPPLESVLRSCDTLLLSDCNGGHLSLSAYRKAFKSFLGFLCRCNPDLSKYPTIRAHDLRHTFCMMCFDNGVNVVSTQAWLGHASPKTTLDTYAHISAQRESADAEAFRASFTHS